MPFVEKFPFFRENVIGLPNPVLATFSISPATSIVNGNVNAVFNVTTNLTTSPVLSWNTLYETANIFIDNTTTGTVTPNGAGIGTITRQVYDDAVFALQLTYGAKTLATSANVTVQNINYTFSNVSSPFYNDATFNVSSILPVGTTIYWSLTGTNTGIFNATTGSAVVGAGGNISIPISINSSTQYYTEATIALQLRTLSPTGRIVATSSNYIAVRTPEYFALHPLNNLAPYTGPANIASSPSLSNIASGYNGRWQGAVVAPGGNIYAAPANGSITSRILKINTTTNTTSVLTLPSNPTGFSTTSYTWTGGSLVNDSSGNKLISFIPSGARWILEVNPLNDNRAARYENNDRDAGPMRIFAGGGAQYNGAVATPYVQDIYSARTGNILAAPNYINRQLKVNTVGSSYTTLVEPSLSYNFTYEPRDFGSISGETLTQWQNNQTVGIFDTSGIFNAGANVPYDGAVLKPNGNVVYIPHDSARYAEVNPNTGAKQFVSIAGSLGDKWSGGCVGNDGSIYFAPYTANAIYRLRPDGSSNSISVTAGVNKYKGAVAAPDGKIYFIPFAATTILVYNPASNTTSTLGSFGSEVKWHGGVLAPNGSIYCIPVGNGTPILRINLNIGNVQPGHWALSSYYNKY